IVIQRDRRAQGHVARIEKEPRFFRGKVAAPQVHRGEPVSAVRDPAVEGSFATRLDSVWLARIERPLNGRCAGYFGPVPDRKYIQIFVTLEIEEVSPIR